MSAPRVTRSHLVAANSDEASTVSHIAAAENIDLIRVLIKPHGVEVVAHTYDGAKRLAARMNLWMEDNRKHDCGGLSYLHSRWSSGDSPVVVTNASLMADVGARAS